MHNMKDDAMRKTMMLAAAAAMLVAGHAVAADAAKGAVVFNRCKVCHTMGPGLPNKIGPNLWGVVGRKAGTEAGFNYGPGMKAFGKVWTEKELDAYLADPKGVVPGTKMAFAGVKDATERADLIAWLATQK